MRMASYVSRELIPCAFVWLDPGITPCCKTRKLQRQEFFAKTRSGRRSPIRIPSVAVPKSPVSLTREDQSPHVLTRKTRLQPAEFLITCAKRLLQHNPPRSDIHLIPWHVRLGPVAVSYGPSPSIVPRFSIQSRMTRNA